MERQTRQRQAVMQALHTSGRSLSPTEILSLAQLAVPTLSLSTVYRQLKSLVADGQVLPVELPGLPPRFETPPVAPAEGSHAATGRGPVPHTHDDPTDHDNADHAPGGAHGHDPRHAPARAHVHGPAPGPHGTARALPHRHHVHCTACDQVFPIVGCPGGIERLVPPGWTVERHDLTLHGRCPACTTAEASR